MEPLSATVGKGTGWRRRRRPARCRRLQGTFAAGWRLPQVEDQSEVILLTNAELFGCRAALFAGKRRDRRSGKHGGPAAILREKEVSWSCSRATTWCMLNTASAGRAMRMVEG